MLSLPAKCPRALRTFPLPFCNLFIVFKSPFELRMIRDNFHCFTRNSTRLQMNRLTFHWFNESPCQINDNLFKIHRKRFPHFSVRHSRSCMFEQVSLRSSAICFAEPIFAHFLRLLGIFLYQNSAFFSYEYLRETNIH